MLVAGSSPSRGRFGTMNILPPAAARVVISAAMLARGIAGLVTPALRKSLAPAQSVMSWLAFRVLEARYELIWSPVLGVPMKDTPSPVWAPPQALSVPPARLGVGAAIPRRLAR